MRNVYGTYAERIRTYNNFTDSREGGMERIGSYKFEAESLKTYGERMQNVYGTHRNV